MIVTINSFKLDLYLILTNHSHMHKAHSLCVMCLCVVGLPEENTLEKISTPISKDYFQISSQIASEIPYTE